MPQWELIVFFFAIAFVYASVGFGGGSSYLALLSLYALPFQEMRLIALVCNVIVVTGGTIVFLRNGQVAGKKILPIVLVSVPLAYIGASLPISHHIFFMLLGTSLVLAAVLLWVKTQSNVPKRSPGYAHPAINSILGGAIGFLSGMVGIGGGIFLSPVLNIMNWDTAKRIAATASVFILVNSLAGIAGQLSNMPADINYTRIAILACAVLAGGLLGSNFGAVKFSPLAIRRVTAVLVLAAGINVLLKHLP
ncbi:MAG TPA: sulfite exporter TauE/SafE family protein [Flavipsychrobacter sp.]